MILNVISQGTTRSGEVELGLKDSVESVVGGGAVAFGPNAQAGVDSFFDVFAGTDATR